MSLLSFSSTASSSLKLPPLFFSPFSPSSTSLFSSQLPFQPLSSSSSSAALRLPRCRAAVPDPSPPPLGNDSTHLQVFHRVSKCSGSETNIRIFRYDVAASLSKIQDRVQIFFAVLFWMSLFFWASAWDGRDRPNKGSRFKK